MREGFEQELDQLVKWHVNAMPNDDGDCGCADSEQHAWQDMVIIHGDDAYRDHVRTKIMELVEEYKL